MLWRKLNTNVYVTISNCQFGQVCVIWNVLYLFLCYYKTKKSLGGFSLLFYYRTIFSCQLQHYHYTTTLRHPLSKENFYGTLKRELFFFESLTDVSWPDIFISLNILVSFEFVQLEKMYLDNMWFGQKLLTKSVKLPNSLTNETGHLACLYLRRVLSLKSLKWYMASTVFCTWIISSWWASPINICCAADKFAVSFHLHFFFSFSNYVSELTLGLASFLYWSL